MLKSSFALIEILISILLFSFIFISFLNSTFLFSSTNEHYLSLLKLENSLEKDDFTNFFKSNASFKVLINGIETNISLKTHIYKNDNIRVVYYEK